MKLVTRHSSFVVLCALASGALAPEASAQSPWRQADFAAEAGVRDDFAAEIARQLVTSVQPRSA